MDPVDDFSQTSAGDQGLLKHAAGVLRRSAERQDFLLKLSDALRPLRDPLAVQAAACRVLGEHLRASRAYYVEVEPDEEHVVTANDYTNGVPSVSGRYRIADFAPFVLDEYRAGRTVIITDTTTDPRIPDPARAQWAAIGITAQAAVPLVKEGRFVAALGVDQDRPRQWTPDEIALLEETAERTWSTVERARSDTALRESEERFRAAVGAVSDLIWTNSREGLMVGEQPGWSGFTGQSLAEYEGYGWANAVHPEDAGPTIDAWNRAVAEKRTFVFEHRVRRRDGEWRLCSIRAVPIMSPGGEIREWVGVHTDITERRRAENALSTSEADARFLSDLSERIRTASDPRELIATVAREPASTCRSTAAISPRSSPTKTAGPSSRTTTPTKVNRSSAATASPITIRTCLHRSPPA